MERFYDVVLCFFLFGFVGWVCESVFCSINEKKLVNRGFLNGPLCPVYSFGGLAVVYLLAPWQNNIPVLFVFGTIVTSAIEYITSWVLEKLFATKWWDYSEEKYNINGRVCLKFSILFGLLSVVAVRLLHPPFVALMRAIPAGAKPWIAWVCILLFLADCVFTVWGILEMNGTLARLKKASEELGAKLEAMQGGGFQTLQERLERFWEDTTEKATGFRKSLEDMIEKQNESKKQGARKLQFRRLSRAFPKMRSVKYAEQMAELKAAWEEFKKNLKTPRQGKGK